MWSQSVEKGEELTNSDTNANAYELPANLEATLRSIADRHSTELLEISHKIHARPELRFTETYAASLLVDVLDREGFTTEVGVAGLPTAFLGSFGSADDGPTVAIFLEYDALEEIGHACGHNVIAAIGLGAALTVKQWMDEENLRIGKLVVVGSPGEEGGGGKNYLIDSGRLDNIDVAMMMHPEGENLASMATLGRVSLDFEFTGRAAHAAVSPERGINALDSAVLTLNAIGLLRQQLPSDVRVHAIVIDGGEAPNIIPERSVVRVSFRAPDSQFLVEHLQPRIENCAKGAALATGATVSIKQESPTYAAMQPNPVLGAIVEANFTRVGRTSNPQRAEAFPGSTDMGNVSQIIPSIHPCIEFVPGLGMHTREATSVAGGPDADKALLDGTLILAMTAAQVFATPGVLDAVKDSFVEGVRIGI